MNEELYNHGITDKPNVFNPVTPWVRNAEWLEMPTVSPTERKIVILARVDPGIGNYVAFNVTVTGGYTVDWGDGTSGNFASAANSLKQYDFAAVPGSATTMGYKQVLITITPQVPANTITGANLALKHTATGLTGHLSPFLDMIVSIPGATTRSNFTFIATNPGANYLERFQLIASAFTTYSTLLQDAIAIQSVSVASSATVTSMASMFSGCTALQEVPGNLPYSTCTDLSGTFNRCRNLRRLNTSLITTSATTIASMFSNCDSISFIPQFNFTTGTSVNLSNSFTACSKLINIPVANYDKASDLSSAFSFCVSLTSVGNLNILLCTTLASTFADCRALQSVGSLTTSNVLTTVASMFNNCYRLNALPAISNTSAVTSFSSFAATCICVESSPIYDTSSCTNFTSMFNGCRALKSAPNLNFTKAAILTTMYLNAPQIKTIGAMNLGTTTTGAITFSAFCQGSNGFDSILEEIGQVTIPATATQISYANAFSNNRYLKTVNLDCTKVPNVASVATMFNGSLALQNVILTGLRFGAFTIAGSMQVSALIALFTSLGTASGAQTLTVSGNPGWSLLSAAERAIATDKGWTLA